MSRTKVAFVGVGNMGQCAHLRNYAVLDECEVVALAELRPGLAERVAERYNVPNVYGDYEEMLKCEGDVQALVVSQPFTRHSILLPELLRHGLPIFIEKPLAASIEGGQRIIDAMKEAGTWLMVGYHKRSDPATIWARQEIDRLSRSGELGGMKYVRIAMPPGDWVAGGFNDLIQSDEPLPELQVEPRPADMDQEFFDKYLAFVNYYIHQVNLMRHLMGEPYKVVFADRPGVICVVESEGGITGVIEMAAYRTSLDWQETALVTFERGYVSLSLPAPLACNRAGRAELFRDPQDGRPEHLIPQLPPVHAMRNQAANFIAAVKGEREPMCTADEALEDLKVARDYVRMLDARSAP